MGICITIGISIGIGIELEPGIHNLSYDHKGAFSMVNAELGTLQRFRYVSKVFFRDLPPVLVYGRIDGYSFDD
jgi:hypothetical protein